MLKFSGSSHFISDLISFWYVRKKNPARLNEAGEAPSKKPEWIRDQMLTMGGRIEANLTTSLVLPKE